MKEITIRPYDPVKNQIKSFYLIAEEAFAFGSPWTPVQFQETIKRADLSFFVAEYDNELIGYIGGQVLIDCGEIYTIVVKKEFQKKQVAQMLLKAFKDECQKQGAETILLEVRVSNEEAQAFYKKNEFEEIGIRKNYYRIPREDALLMSCSLRKKEKDVKETNFSH